MCNSKLGGYVEKLKPFSYSGRRHVLIFFFIFTNKLLSSQTSCTLACSVRK
ncbi:unnamed protein product [Ixodes persulcatus]